MQEREDFDRKEPLKARLQDMIVSLFTSLLTINFHPNQKKQKKQKRKKEEVMILG